MSAAYPTLAAPPVHQALAGYSASPPAANSAPVPDTTPKPTVAQGAPAPPPPQPSAAQNCPAPAWQPSYGTPPRATVAAVPTQPYIQSAAPASVQAMQHRAPITVAAPPSGCTGGVVGAFVGQALLPIPVVGLLVGAMVGRNLQRNRAKNANTIYIKPEPWSTNPVPVKLWKLGETSPLTDAGLRLVLEARNVDEMLTFLMRLISSRGGRVQNYNRVVACAQHMVASMGLDCTVNGVLAELAQSQ